MPRSRFSVLGTRPIDNENAIGAWWSLAGGSAVDISPSGNMGVLVGAPPTVPGPGLTTGLSLNGSSQNVTTTTNFGNAGSLLTLSLSGWFKTGTASGVSFIMLNGSQDGSSNTTDRGIYIGTDGKVYGYVFVNPSARNAVSSATYTDSQWHFAVVTIQNVVGISLYVDAVFQQTTTFAGSPFSSYTNSWWSIGRNGTNSGTNSAGGRFTGSIADIRYYNRVLTPGEISAEYNRVLAGLSLRPDEWEVPAINAVAANYLAKSRLFTLGMLNA